MVKYYLKIHDLKCVYLFRGVFGSIVTVEYFICMWLKYLGFVIN